MAEFGPNEPAVERFLDRLELLGDDDLLRLVAAWEGGSGERRKAAWRSARRAAAAGKREDAIKRAQSAVLSWSNRRSPLISDTFAGTFAAGNQMSGDIARNAMPALVDAVGALVVRDAVPAEVFEELYGPFDSLVEDDRAR